MENENQKTTFVIVHVKHWDLYSCIIPKEEFDEKEFRNGVKIQTGAKRIHLKIKEVQ